MQDADGVQRMESKFRAFGPLLNERLRRQWAGAEATAYGWGGVQAVSQATGLSPTTIRKGQAELAVREAKPNKVDDNRRQNFFRFLVESLPLPTLRDHLDRHSCVKYRRLDVQLHVFMANDLARFVPLDGLPGAGRRELTYVLICDSLRRARRYRR